MGQRGEPEPLRHLLRHKPQAQPGQFKDTLQGLFLYLITIQKHFKFRLLPCIFKWQEEEKEEEEEQKEERKEEEPSRETNDK